MLSNYLRICIYSRPGISYSSAIHTPKSFYRAYASFLPHRSMTRNGWGHVYVSCLWPSGMSSMKIVYMVWCFLFIYLLTILHYITLLSLVPVCLLSWLYTLSHVSLAQKLLGGRWSWIDWRWRSEEWCSCTELQYLLYSGSLCSCSAIPLWESAEG